MILMTARAGKGIYTLHTYQDKFVVAFNWEGCHYNGHTTHDTIQEAVDIMPIERDDYVPYRIKVLIDGTRREEYD